MDSVTLTKQNRLFWLGRYAERICTTIQYLIELYDDILDEKDVNYPEICNRLGVPCVYTSAEDFCRRYTFEKTNPFSVRSSAENMLGNGMVLRETISSETLAYLQMARNAIAEAADSEVPTVGLQTAVDYIMAFRGSYDDYILSLEVRNLIKVGRSVERLSLMLRLNYRTKFLEREIQKLLSRVDIAGLKVNADAEAVIRAAAEQPEAADCAALCIAVEGLFTL